MKLRWLLLNSFLLVTSGLLSQSPTLPATVDWRHCQSQSHDLPSSPDAGQAAACAAVETFAGVPISLQPHPSTRLRGPGTPAERLRRMLHVDGLVPIDDSTRKPAIGPRITADSNAVLIVGKAEGVAKPEVLQGLLAAGNKGVIVWYNYRKGDWTKENGLTHVRGKAQWRDSIAVLVVGYDAEGFIFKESLANGPFSGGWGRMSFAYHAAHAAEGMVVAMVEPQFVPGTPAATSAHVRLQPDSLDGKRYLMATLVPVGGGALPPLAQLTYKISADGSSPTEKRASTQGLARANGYPVLLPFPTGSGTVQVTVQWIGKNGQPAISHTFKDVHWALTAESVKLN